MRAEAGPHPNFSREVGARQPAEREASDPYADRPGARFAQPRKGTPAERPRWPGPFERPDVPRMLRRLGKDGRERVQRTGRVHLVPRCNCLVAGRAA